MSTYVDEGSKKDIPFGYIQELNTTFLHKYSVISNIMEHIMRNNSIKPMNK